MTEIEKKALALVNEVQTDCKGRSLPDEPLKAIYLWEALCRAIEAHEVFRREVSDVVISLLEWPSIRSQAIIASSLSRFIKPPVDPLEEAKEYVLGANPCASEANLLSDFIEAVEARGGRIVFEGEG